MEEQTTAMAAPPVRTEPCADFCVDDAAHGPICNACGWLDEDHTLVDAGAIVTELPRRGVQLPARIAS
jgi:hypothetical protein